ncbi:MAG: secretin N-terminal domain-containing protein, partial [Planctomycetota bacterium]
MKIRQRVITLALLTTYLCTGLAMGQEQGQPLTTTKVYRVNQANVETLTNELKAAFADDPAIRIAGEVNTGRIVVVAPDDVHKQLGPLMRDTGGIPVAETPARPLPQQPTPQPPQRPEPMTAKDGPGNRVVGLQNLSSMDLRNSVSRLYQGRAPSQKSEDGRTETMVVGSDSSNAVRLRFDFATNNIFVQGKESSVEAWQRLIRVLDNPSVVRDERTTLVSVSGQRPRSIHRAMDLIELRTNGKVRKPTTRADIVQWNLDNKKPVNPRRPETQLAQAPGGQQPPPGTLPAQPPAGGGEQEGLLGPVQIEYLDGLDVIVLRGNKKDVDRVNAIIKEIEDLSVVTEPTIEIVDLEHVDSEAMADIIGPLQDEVLSVRQGRVSITPLVKPNSLLLLGREESVKVVKDLILKLDRPVEPNKQFHVFRLSNANAAEAEELITNFYEERGGLGTRLRIVSDFRSNSVIVQASPRDAAEIRDLLAKMDVSQGSAVSEVRVFKLKNSYAEDLAPILEGALRGGGGASATGDGGFQGGDTGGTSASRATALSLTTVDAQGQRQYQSGVLADVEVTADTRTNAIVVRGPADSMELIEALICVGERSRKLPSFAVVF